MRLVEGAAERIDPAGANRRLERAVSALADSNLYPFEFRDFCVTESGNAKAETDAAPGTAGRVRVGVSCDMRVLTVQCEMFIVLSRTVDNNEQWCCEE